MYLDHVLLIIGGISCIVAIFLLFYLARSKKRSQFYQNLLEQDRERFNAYTYTMSQMRESNTQDITNTVDLNHGLVPETELLEPDDTVLLNAKENNMDFGFNTEVLEGKYIIEKEIYGGGMSRVFLVTSTKLGNKWVLKYIDRKNGSLANEENILKLLNNISLPKIIDIFHDENGVYIVQSYIEGVSLDKVIEAGNTVGQTLLLDWVEQMTQVLSYLHNLEPHPIIHCDLKPSNIMITHDNKLVLIDFGISKRLDSHDSEIKAVTYKYAAPEQLKHTIRGKEADLIYERFGELPEDRFSWGIDERTDIYSLGVILYELATGRIPTYGTEDLIKEFLPEEFSRIILKCIEEDPEERYQNAEYLLEDIYRIKDTKSTIVKSLVLRRVATGLMAFAFVLSGGSFASGVYIRQQENLSLVYMEPDAIMMSEQQSAELSIQKIKPNKDVVAIDTNDIKWSMGNNDIARIDGNRIVGLNIGTTEVVGKYRNKIITLNVDVVEKIDGMVDISLCYKGDNLVSKFAGSGEREHIDDNLAYSSFVSPESIAKTTDGTIYLSDAGIIKKIKDGKVESISFEPEYITAKIIRAYEDELYVLTDPWEDDDGVFYGIIKMSDNGVEGLYIGDAVFTSIEDFDFTKDGELYFVENNIGTGISMIKAIDTKELEVQEICKIEDGIKAIAIDPEGNIYLANPERGLIQKYDSNTKAIKYFAGVDGQRHFIDGSVPLLYEPIKLYYSEGNLYVLDFNVIRKITIENGIATIMETIAGEVSTETNPSTLPGKADSVVFAHSNQSDFIVEENTILFTDPKKSVVWQIDFNND